MPRRTIKPGDEFDRLTVLAPAGKSPGRRGRQWLCRCRCGNTKVVLAAKLNSRDVRSCGCLRSEQKRAQLRTHGLTGTTTYNIWHGMLQRCRDPKQKDYPRYGGRGITVCQRWAERLENFLADMGERPAGMQLERKENDGSYRSPKETLVL